MKAITYSDFGRAAEVLKVCELPVSEPGPGEVRVHIVASGVNPIDVKRRAGGRGPKPSASVIPHFDGAGVVDRVGQGVPESRIGQRVWVYEAQWQRDRGTAAEFVVLPARCAVGLPDQTTFEEGACLGIPALTAHRCLFRDGPVTDQTILVTGGAGAVGHYAVQLAKLGGARVIATISNEEKGRLAADAGADHVVNYRIEAVALQIKKITAGAGVDRVVEVEFGGNIEAALEVLKPGGVIATYASAAVPEPTIPFYRFLYKNITVRCELVLLMPEEAKQAAVSDVGYWLEQCRLRHHIAECFPLEATAAAHEAVERGAFGKVIVQTGTDR